MKNVAETFRHADSAAKKDYLAAGFMRLPHCFDHIFDAAVKFFARLAFDKEGCSGCTKLFERDATVSCDQGRQVSRRNEDLIRRKDAPAGILRLRKPLLESSEEFLVCFVEEFWLIQNQHREIRIVEQRRFQRLNDRHQV